jgi:hypothetical protein
MSQSQPVPVRSISLLRLQFSALTIFLPTSHDHSLADEKSNTKMRLTVGIAVALLLQSSMAFVPSVGTSRHVATKLFEKEETKTNAPGHEVRPSGPLPDLTEEESAKLQEQAQKFMAYQQEAPKLDWPTGEF